MAEGEGSIDTWDPKDFLRKVCEGAGDFSEKNGKITCAVKDGVITIDPRELSIETDDAGIAVPLDKIEMCYVMGNGLKRYGYCKMKRSGGVLMQIDPANKELVVLATRGPLTAQIAVDKGVENIRIKI